MRITKREAESLRGRRVRFAKNDKQALFPSLVFLDLSPDETRPRSEVVQAPAKEESKTAKAFKWLLMCKLSFRASETSSKTGLQVQNRHRLCNSSNYSRDPQRKSRRHTSRFQNPSYRTLKRPALSVFLEKLAQNGSSALFAMGTPCATRSLKCLMV